MAETPHDPTSSSCGCRACALNRRRLGTSSPPFRWAPEPELAPAGDATSPPEPAPCPLEDCGCRGTEDHDLCPECGGRGMTGGPAYVACPTCAPSRTASAASRPEPAPLLRIGYATVDKRKVDALVKAYRRSAKAERTGRAARRRAVIDLSDLGLSVRAIAERVDLDPQTVHRWTRGEE